MSVLTFYDLLLLSNFRGKKVFEPPRYMTVNQAVEQLLQVVQNRREQGEELGEHFLGTLLLNFKLPYHEI